MYPPKLISLKNRFDYFSIDCNQQKARMTCAKCKDIVIKPHQSECGCRFCFYCLNDYQKHCPGCKEYFKSTKRNYFYYKSLEKELLELKMNCINKNCTHILKLKDLINHLEVCEDREENKDLCIVNILKKRNIFETKETNCYDCGLRMLRKDFKEKHRNIAGGGDSLCNQWIRFCPYKCDGENKVNVKTHLQVCPEVNMPTKVCIEQNFSVLNNCFFEKTFVVSDLFKKMDNARKKNETKVYLTEYVEFLPEFVILFYLDITNEPIRFLIMIEKQSVSDIEHLPTTITVFIDEPSSSGDDTGGGNSFDTSNQIFNLGSNREVGRIRLYNFLKVSLENKISFKVELYSIPFAEVSLFDHN